MYGLNIAAVVASIEIEMIVLVSKDDSCTSGVERERCQKGSLLFPGEFVANENNSFGWLN